MSVGKTVVLGLVVTVVVVLLSIGAGSSVWDSGINSLIGNGSSEGVINDTENLTYGDSSIYPSSLRQENLSIIKEAVV